MFAIQSFTDYLRDAVVSSTQPESRRIEKDLLEAFQRVTVITMVACAAIFLMVPKVWTFLVLGTLSYLAFEAGLVARNYREILTTREIESVASVSRNARIEQLGKEAPLARAILRITLPE